MTTTAKTSPQHPFVAGPYKPPKVRKGQTLYDEWLGEVQVQGFTDSPIRWPATVYRGKLTPILCGDLVRAIVEEVELTVARHWGVSKYHIDQWKKALAGGGTSSEVYAKLVLLKHDPAFRQKYGYAD
jgi:hypothetical protein